jgi:hypothetical protein
MDQQGFESTRLPDKQILPFDLLQVTLDVVHETKGLKFWKVNRQIYGIGNNNFRILLGFEKKL